MVNVGTGSSRTRFIKTDWPVTDGITAGTTTQKNHKEWLEPEEESHVSANDKKGVE